MRSIWTVAALGVVVCLADAPLPAADNAVGEALATSRQTGLPIFAVAGTES